MDMPSTATPGTEVMYKLNKSFLCDIKHHFAMHSNSNHINVYEGATFSRREYLTKKVGIMQILKVMLTFHLPQQIISFRTERRSDCIL